MGLAGTKNRPRRDASDGEALAEAVSQDAVSIVQWSMVLPVPVHCIVHYHYSLWRPIFFRAAFMLATVYRS